MTARHFDSVVLILCLVKYLSFSYRPSTEKLVAVDKAETKNG